ncbi:BnaC02g24080D [Brassica napus]|uniref:(rape) hypothetical protein n=1 Tax=Brassica napus TaxID=3708 RepID=A0A078G706_BRANA|nr:unnamed protein product [Brassica napus]CDY20408.1 BnaC02g24080D [Brassica napus]
MYQCQYLMFLLRFDVKPLCTGKELRRYTLPFQSGSRIYKLEGLEWNSCYEVKISYLLLLLLTKENVSTGASSSGGKGFTSVSTATWVQFLATADFTFRPQRYRLVFWV